MDETKAEGVPSERVPRRVCVVCRRPTSGGVDACGAHDPMGCDYTDTIECYGVGLDVRGEALIRLLWRAVADGEGCVCEEGATVGATTWDREATDLCQAMRALGWGEHWNAEIFQRRATDMG